MAADDHVRRSFEALAARLQEDIARELDAVASELTSRIHEARARAAEDARAQALAEAADDHAAALARARQDAREEADREAAERLAASVSEAELRGHAAGRDAGRRDWEEARIEALELARAEREGADLAASTRLVDSVRAIDRAGSLSEILDALVAAVAREAARVAVLLVRGDRLRAWRLSGFGEADAAVPFELPVADAGIIGDAVRAAAAVSADARGDEVAPAFALLPAGRERLALPIAMSGQIVAVLYADQGVGEARARAAWPLAVETLARHAARSLEAVTAFRALQVLTDRPGAPAAAPAPDAAPPVHGDEEEAARRYARLLISEIKLYHEAEVAAGRLQGNLTTRLGGEIARARALYEQRVGAGVRATGDYFDEELVRTLADGDASLIRGAEPEA